MTHTVVPTTHTVVVCVMKGWRGKPLITMGLLMLVSSTHLVVTGEKTHTVVVCVVRGGGRTPGEHGALKVVFQLCFDRDRPTQWFRLPT